MEKTAVRTLIAVVAIVIIAAPHTFKRILHGA